MGVDEILDHGSEVGLRRSLSSIEDLFAKMSPHVGTTCQWFRIARGIDGRACDADGTTGAAVPCAPDELVAALRCAHRRFVPLRCVLERGDDDDRDGMLRLSFRSNLEPDISVRETESVGEVALERLAASEATAGLAPDPDGTLGKPLWRAVVLKDGWVVLTLHHVISDGSSRKQFMKVMLESLSGKESENGTTSSIAISPGLDELLEEATTAKGMASSEDGNMNANAVPSSDGGVKPPCWPNPDGTAPVSERKMQAPSAVVPGASSLRAACRSRGVSVTPALIAALALTVRGQLPADPAENVPVHTISISVDARRHVREGGEGLFGCYVFGYRTRDAISVRPDDSIWSVARQVARDMRDCSSLSTAVAACRRYREIMNAPITPEAVEGFMEIMNGRSQGRDNPLNVSNISVVEATSSCGTVRIDRLFSVTSQTSVGSYVCLNAATVNDALFVTLGSVWPFVSEERGRLMLENFVALLRSASEGS